MRLPLARPFFHAELLLVLCTLCSCGPSGPAATATTWRKSTHSEAERAPAPSLPTRPLKRAPAPARASEAALREGRNSQRRSDAPASLQLGKAELRFIEPWPWGVSTERRGSPLLRAAAEPTPKASAPKSHSWSLKKTLHVGQSHLSVAALTGDGRFAVVASEIDLIVRLFEISSGRLIAQHRLPQLETSEPFDLTILPFPCVQEQPELPCLAVGTPTGLVSWSPLTGKTVQRLSSVAAHQLRFSPDQELLGATASQVPAQTSQLVLYRLDAAKAGLSPVLLASFAERVDDWALSPSRKLLALLYYPSDRLQVLDLEQQQELFSVPVPKFANGVDFSSDERWLAVGGERLEVLPIDDPSRVRTFDKYGNNIHQVRFNATTQQWVTSSYDGRIRILALSSGKDEELDLVQTLNHARTANVYALSFSNDGTQLLSSSGDQTLKLWSLPARTQPASLRAR